MRFQYLNMNLREALLKALSPSVLWFSYTHLIVSLRDSDPNNLQVAGLDFKHSLSWHIKHVYGETNSVRRVQAQTQTT